MKRTFKEIDDAPAVARKLKGVVIREKCDSATQPGPLAFAMGKFTDEVSWTEIFTEDFHKPGQEWLLEDVINSVSFRKNESDKYDFHIIGAHAHQVFH